MTEPIGPWLRLWCSLLENPKFMMLSADDKEAWILMLLSTKRDGTDGEVLPLDRLAFACRKGQDWCRIALDSLVEKGLIDRLKGGSSGGRYRFHDWDEWQVTSNASTDRVRRFRERSRNVTETVPRARASSEQNTETEQSVVAHAREPQTIENQDKNKTEKTEPGTLVQANDTEAFNRVWQFYLEFGDARSRRERAEAQWQKIPWLQRGRVVQGLIVYRLSKAEGTPVKFLETWLDERMWRDYPLSLNDGRYAAIASRYVQKLMLDDADEQAEAS